MISMACIRLRPALSIFETLAMQPVLTAQMATLAAAPGNPRQKVQHVWSTFYPHFLAHFYNLASHPDVSLHFVY